MSQLSVPNHLGIIMDGNGRWAQKRGLPRSSGHQAGAETLRRVTEACIEMNIPFLTLYTFSTENWSRPVDEVDFIMYLIEKKLIDELPEMNRNGIRIQFMGKRKGLSKTLLLAMDKASEETQRNNALVLNLAVNYGGRTEIVDAIKVILEESKGNLSNELNIDESLFAQYLYCPDCPEADLVIRTGSEWRMSNFLTWRATHAVFLSTPVYWPDFNRQHLQELVKQYGKH
ncbi:MAG: di-trans,poly-cis-decaprenylcistransferase [Anaerolineaceae bacterium]|jgi:undecaprenyl diphosphate synthase|nr:di-trans,poly-cis-decaprenylcistransferase [Anaerolineaceae bacterium]